MLTTVESPFENQTEIIGVAKRSSKQGVKARKKRNKPTHPDKEIQAEIQQHGIDAVNIIYDSSWQQELNFGAFEVNYFPNFFYRQLLEKYLFIYMQYVVIL